MTAAAGRRRMEPFSSKIEIPLRDRLNAHLDASGETIIGFLDAAIRARLDALEPPAAPRQVFAPGRRYVLRPRRLVN